MLMKNNDATVPNVKMHLCYNKIPVENALIRANSVLGFKKP